MVDQTAENLQAEEDLARGKKSFGAETLAGCAGELASAADALAAGSPDAVHKMRTTLRRAREAARLFAGAEEGKALDEELRELARVLAPARELDVLLAEGLSGEEAAPVRPALEARRAAAWEAAADAIAPDRLAVLAARLSRPGSPAEDEDRNEPARAADALRGRWRKAKKAAAALEGADADALHRFRIRCKKLSLAIALLEDEASGAGSRGAERLRAALARLQRHLGRLNDAASHARRLADLAREEPALAFAAGRLAERQDKGRRKRLKKAARAWSEARAVGPFWRK